MDDFSADSAIGLNMINRSLVVAVNSEPDDAYLKRLREEILAVMDARTVKSVLFDVSRVRAIDSVLFGMLADAGRMAGLLGAKTVFVGFSAGTASALAELDINLDGIETAVTMDDALDFVNSSSAGEPFSQDDRQVVSDDDA